MNDKTNFIIIEQKLPLFCFKIVEMSGDRAPSFCKVVQKLLGFFGFRRFRTTLAEVVINKKIRGLRLFSDYILFSLRLFSDYILFSLRFKEKTKLSLYNSHDTIPKIFHNNFICL